MLEVYQWLEYTRQSLLLSKHEMAERLHISSRTYSTMLREKKVSQRVFEKAIDVMGYRYIDQDLFESLNNKLALVYRNILYVDYTKAKALVEELNVHADILKNSTLAKTYYLYMFMYLAHTQDMIFDIDFLEHQCALFTPFMNREEKNIHAIVLNGYYYIKGDFIKSLQVAKDNIDNVTNPHLKALSYFLMGASSVNEIGQIEQSLEYLTEGQKIFENFANYARAQRCQAFILVGLVHSQRYKDFFDGYQLFQEIPVLEEDKARVFNFIEGTKARYHMLIGETHQALTILKGIDRGSSINEFLKCIGFILEESWDQLDQFIKKDKLAPIIANRIHRQLIEISEHYLYKKDDKRFALSLVKLMKQVHQSKDYISTMLITEITVKACVKQRMFKDAHQLMQKKLALLC